MSPSRRTPSTSRRGAGLLVAALVAAACRAPAPASTAEAGAPAELDSSPLTREMAEERARQVRDVRYALRFELDAEHAAYRGRAELGFELAPDARGDLLVDFRDGSILALSVNGAAVAPEEVAPRYDGFRLHLATAALRPGRNRVEIDFAHAYSTTGNGLHRFQDPIDARVYTYSNFEPYNANRMFPCFDQPDLKASYEVTVEAPADWTVVANTREREVATRDGRSTWRFPESAVFSTYVFALHAGPYASWAADAGGIPTRLFARQSLAPYVEHAEWLEVTRQGLAFYGERFGVAYPFGKYDQLIVPEFNAGAMENVAAVTFSERYVSRSRFTEDQKRDRADTILHEMAHMWFGDLVTMRWWNGLWLNESFATWASAGAVDEATRFEGSWQAFFGGMKRWGYHEDRLVTSHPIEVPVPDTDQAFANFDGITYGKGASVLQQLSFFLGEEAFRDGLRLYFRRFAYGNTGVEDFVGALAEASGRDLSAWQRAWLETAGPNTVEVSWACAPDPRTRRPAISQLQLLQSPSEWSHVLRPHRTRVGLYSARGGQRLGEPISISYAGAETAVAEAVGRPCPDFVYPNDGDRDFAVVALDPASLAAIRGHVSTLSDPMLRQQLWHTLWERVVDGRLAPRDYAEAALSEIPAERSTLVLVQVLGSLARASLDEPSTLSYLPQAERPAARARMERAFRRGLEAAPAGSDLQLDWYFALLEVARDPETLALFEGLLDARREVPGLRIDQDRRWELLHALARAGAPGIRDRVAAELARDPTDTGSKAAIAAEASLPDAASKAAWRARIAAPPGPDAPGDADLRAAMRAFQVLGQEELVEDSVDWYFATLPGFAATRDEDLVDDFSAAMFPGLCDERIVRRVDELLTGNPGLRAAAVKRLRVARQETERCIRARQHPGGAPAPR